MLKVQRFVNELMTSNCYVVYDDDTKHCLVIDPGSEKSLREIVLIESNKFVLDYIFITHEHTDHTWGVNALIDRYPSVKMICSELCKEALPKEVKTYFQFYYDDPSYVYNVKRVDYTTEEIEWHLKWDRHNIKFIPTPGHSPGSICIVIDGNMIFGGDTLMPYRPFIKKRNGGSLEQYHASVSKMKKIYSGVTKIYPGHGEMLDLSELKY